MKKYIYTVSVLFNDYPKTFDFDDWDDVNNFLGYMVHGSTFGVDVHIKKKEVNDNEQ